MPAKVHLDVTRRCGCTFFLGQEAAGRGGSLPVDERGQADAEEDRRREETRGTTAQETAGNQGTRAARHHLTVT